MNRSELIRLFVLAEISDDYEEIEHISENVTKRARACGMSSQAKDVQAALAELLELGLAKAYLLSCTDPVVEIQGVPPLDQFGEYYFWITDKGQEAHASWRKEWPLDDEDSLLPGWSLRTE
jgi:hypothetical protein